MRCATSFLSSVPSALRCARHTTLCCSVVVAVAAPPIHAGDASLKPVHSCPGPAAASAQYPARPAALPPPGAAVAGTPAQQPGWRTLPAAVPPVQQVCNHGITLSSSLLCSEPIFVNGITTASVIPCKALSQNPLFPAWQTLGGSQLLRSQLDAHTKSVHCRRWPRLSTLMTRRVTRSRCRRSCSRGPWAGTRGCTCPRTRLRRGASWTSARCRTSGPAGPSRRLRRATPPYAGSSLRY